ATPPRCRAPKLDLSLPRYPLWGTPVRTLYHTGLRTASIAAGWWSVAPGRWRSGELAPWRSLGCVLTGLTATGEFATVAGQRGELAPGTRHRARPPRLEAPGESPRRKTSWLLLLAGQGRN